MACRRSNYVKIRGWKLLKKFYVPTESFVLKIDGIVLRFAWEYNFADRLSRTIAKYKVKKLSDSKFCKKRKKKKRLARHASVLCNTLQRWCSYILTCRKELVSEYFFFYCTNVAQIIPLCINSLELHSCKIISVD